MAAATMMLANFGAEVTKIEEPRGDYARHMPPLVDGESAVFRATNRGKKSIALDLKTVDGRKTLLEMVVRADVLIEGFRPGVMKRLGLDYETHSDSRGIGTQMRGIDLVPARLELVCVDGPIVKDAAITAF